MNNLIGAIVIAAVVGGALVYNGHQERLQVQCLAAMDRIGRTSMEAIVARYGVPALTGAYGAGWGRDRS